MFEGRGKSRQRNWYLWPACLLGLSLCASFGWQMRDAWIGERIEHRAPVSLQPLTPTRLALRHFAESPLIPAEPAGITVRAASSDPLPLRVPPVEPTLPETLIQTVSRQSVSHESVLYRVELRPESLYEEFQSDSLPQEVSEPIAEDPAGADSTVEQADEQPSAVDQSPPGELMPTPRGTAFPPARAYPAPRQLLLALESLAGDPEAAPWAEETSNLVLLLSEATRADDPRLEVLLHGLDQAIRESEAAALRTEYPAVQSEIRRISHALTRRMELWWAIHLAATRLGGDREEAAQGEDSPWLLAAGDDGATEAEPRSEANPLRTVSLPRTRLPMRGRTAPPTAGNEAVPMPAISAGEIYGELLDARELMRQLEWYESDRRPSRSREIAAGRVFLAAAATPELRRFDHHLEAHYRNANLRIAVTETLLNRMLPQPEPFGGRVNDYVLGVPVHGTSSTMTRLQARLVPDPYRFRFDLEAHGRVDSQTAARSAPATLYSRGATTFVARKPLAVSPQGLAGGPAVATAINNSRLTNVSSDYDEVPLIGSIIRNIAQREHQERRFAANREVERKVVRQVQDQFDREVAPLVRSNADRFQQEIWQRAVDLGLEPTAVEMQTSGERLTARLRLAADDQLAAHTPRPRAPSDSLMSMQIHESLLNNGLQQLGLEGRTFTLREAYRHVAQMLGDEQADPPEDIPDDVLVTFPPQNALQVHFSDGAMRLTIALARVSRGSERWSNLVVTSYYEPQGEGLDARLVRESGIQLAGDRINARSQIILRGVFARLLDRSRHLQLVPETLRQDAQLSDLEVTQFQIADGWVGIAIGPRHSTEAESEVADKPRWRLSRAASAVRRG